MDYTPTNPTPLSPSDYSGAAADLRGHSADAMSDFAATQPQTVKEVAVEKAKTFREYAGEKASAFKETAAVKLQQGKEKAKQMHSSAEDYVREHPTKSVLGALGVGIVIGLIMRR